MAGPTLKELSTLKSTHDYSAEELRRVREATDDELMQMAGSMDLAALVESMRRLRVAIHGEEHAIKWLTLALVVLTAALLGLGAFGFWRH